MGSCRLEEKRETRSMPDRSGRGLNASVGALQGSGMNSGPTVLEWILGSRESPLLYIRAGSLLPAPPSPILPVPPARRIPSSSKPLLLLSAGPRTHTGHIRKQETEDQTGEVKCPLLPPAPRECGSLAAGGWLTPQLGRGSAAFYNWR